MGYYCLPCEETVNEENSCGVLHNNNDSLGKNNSEVTTYKFYRTPTHFSKTRKALSFPAANNFNIILRVRGTYCRRFKPDKVIAFSTSLVALSAE